MNHLFSRRRAALLAAAALPLATIGATAPAASAAVVGHLLVSPSTGSQSTVLDVETQTACPAGSTNIRVELTGPGINPADVANIMLGTTAIGPGTTPPNAQGGYHLALSEKFGDIFAANNVTSPSGLYTLTAVCLDDSAFTSLGELTGNVQMTPTGGSFNASFAQVSNGETTTTSLAATPADPVVQGTSSTLTATVSPAGAVGSVQFKNGAANLGAAVALSSGVAAFTGALPAGTANLTAVFVPTDPNAFAPSTSAAVGYVVVSPAAVTGTVAVGNPVTCSVSAGGTQTFAWRSGGTVIAGATAKTVTVPAGWAGAALSCQVTVTKGATSVEQTSPARTVAKGRFVLKKKPALSGTPKVGSKLTCSTGKWSPAASSYSYKWLRSGKAIARANKASYRLKKADKGDRVGCQVTAKRAGYVKGAAKSATKAVR